MRKFTKLEVAVAHKTLLKRGKTEKRTKNRHEKPLGIYLSAYVI